MTDQTTKGCEEHGEHTIELDCQPGSLRPWHLIDGVLEGTGLSTDQNSDGNHPFTFFGEATWRFDDVSCAEWDRVQDIIAPRIEALYKSGRIRYGSW